LLQSIEIQFSVTKLSGMWHAARSLEFRPPGVMLDQTLIRGSPKDSLHILLICIIIGRSSGKGFYGSSHRL